MEAGSQNASSSQWNRQEALYSLLQIYWLFQEAIQGASGNLIKSGRPEPHWCKIQPEAQGRQVRAVSCRQANRKTRSRGLRRVGEDSPLAK